MTQQKDYELYKAVESNNLELTKKILEDKSLIFTVFNDSNINYAANNNHEILNVLLQDGRFDPTRLGNNAFREAARFGHYESTKLLLNDPRVDPTDCDNCTILNVVDEGHIEILKLLLEDGRSSPHNQYNSILSLSVRRFYMDITRLLLKDKRIDPSHNENAALMEAFEYENEEAIKLLWRYKKVRDNLKNEDNNLFNNLNKKYINEKIDNF